MTPTTPLFAIEPLRCLQALAAEPHGSLEELRRLQRQVSSAVAQTELGHVVSMTDDECRRYASRFGQNCFVVGDFKIQRIS